MYSSSPAIILNRQVFREDDLLVTAYTQDHGKVRVIATGAKKILSKLAGHIEPASLSYLNIVSGKTLDRLIGAQIIKSYAEIKNDLAKIKSAMWFLNLLDKLTLENHKDERIFHLLEKYLDFLAGKGQDYDIAEMSASFKLLYLLGLNPALKTSFQSEIDFIIKNKIEDIIQNKNILQKQKELKQILETEITEHLN
jgi:DNA repair protein RecO (recombination protein O)